MMHRHIHISAIECDARKYDASKGTYVCTRSKWQKWTCDVDTCMACKRSRQWLSELRMSKGRKRDTKVWRN